MVISPPGVVVSSSGTPVRAVGKELLIQQEIPGLEVKRE